MVTPRRRAPLDTYYGRCLSKRCSLKRKYTEDSEKIDAKRIRATILANTFAEHRQLVGRLEHAFAGTSLRQREYSADVGVDMLDCSDCSQRDSVFQ